MTVISLNNVQNTMNWPWADFNTLFRAALLNPLITVMLHINNTRVVPTFNYAETMSRRHATITVAS